MSISRLYGVDKVRAGHSFRAYFIVDPDQVIMMTMLILRNMMMLRNAEDDNAAEEDDVTDDGLNDEVDDHQAGGLGQGGGRPSRGSRHRRDGLAGEEHPQPVQWGRLNRGQIRPAILQIL